MKFSRAQEIASWYQSPGVTGKGFATFASTGEATDDLWANIDYVRNEGTAKKEGTEDWVKDMAELEKLLEINGMHRPETLRPATFAEAHEQIRSGAQRYRLQNAARTWLEANGKGGAWSGTLDEVLAAVDRFYDYGTIGFVIDHT